MPIFFSPSLPFSFFLSFFLSICLSFFFFSLSLSLSSHHFASAYLWGEMAGRLCGVRVRLVWGRGSAIWIT